MSGGLGYLSVDGRACRSSLAGLATELATVKVVKVPDRIPIVNRWHTETIGTYAGGQFYAMFRGARTGDPTLRDPAATRHPRRWLVYLHLFDHDGNHRSTDVRLISTADRMSEADREHGHAVLAELIASLDRPEFGPISIRPFRIDIDDVVFGLIDESAERDGAPWAELYPDRFGFHPPWNGEYDT